MNLRNLTAIVAASAISTCHATTPPAPGLTSGSGDAGDNGMKHANVALDGTELSVHIADPPATPVAMTSGHGVDYAPDKFDVLEGVYFNAQYGWLPGGILSPPDGAAVWIRRTAASYPDGAAFRVYEGGNMMEGMDAWSMEEIYANDGDVWRWDGLMQHDYYTVDMPGDYSMSFEIYFGDSAGTPIAGYSPAVARFEFTAIPEPSSVALALAAAIVCVGRWWR
ncbi:MAG: hypothetical protein AAF961_06845 [Planctomycetota bacterium]